MLSGLRRMALNLLKREDSLNVGIAAKRKRAGRDEEYLLKVLKQYDAIALVGELGSVVVKSDVLLPSYEAKGWWCV